MSASAEAAVADTVTTLEHKMPARPSGQPCELGPLLARLICSDDPAAGSSRHFLAGLAEVSIGRATFDGSSVEGKRLCVRLRDSFASTRQTALVRAGRGWAVRDEGSRNGTRVDGHLLSAGQSLPLRGGELIEAGHTFFLFRDSSFGLGGEPVESLNPEWELELSRAEKLARTGQELLIEGESGVGKELLARRLHEASGRPGPLVGVNCAALPDTLLDDELFGHVKGAFSGAAADRQGLIRAADGGTLLLDEVGDMSPPLQARLLRVLENHQVRPLGSEREHLADVRFICATHRDLRALVTQGTFRHDLLARLGILSIRVPPLRERREDLGILIRAILAEAGPVRFELEALRALLLHRWPLNVRELRRVLLSAAELARTPQGTVIALHHLPPLPEAPPPPPAVKVLTPEEEALRHKLRALLADHRGNVAAVARRLGRSRSHVQRLMARLGVERRA
jgi:hypothetical protein